MIFEVPVTAALVKAEANRRIEAVYPLWRQANVLREGGAAVEAMGSFIDTIRDASDRLEVLSPIPADYRAEHYWTIP